jgi:V/A-type H+-transporting ATPase subunit A
MGSIVRVAGPVVEARDLPGVRLEEVVRVGVGGLVAEAIRLERDRVVLQVHEDTTGLRVGDPAEATGEPLSVELGPGLLGGIFDGLQRPLPALLAHGPFLPRGAVSPAIAPSARFSFVPSVREGEEVGEGDVLGTVAENPALETRVLVPPGAAGSVHALRSGMVGKDDIVACVGETAVPLVQRQPVRRPRPVAHRLPADLPLPTGQRVLDLLFPLPRGGVAVLAGGFGTGKTVLEQALACWAEVDVVVYVACGERGNELAELLEVLPTAHDPRTGRPLAERTVLLANSSNMPVAAREACLCAGLTVAEWFRDQGREVVLLADSTSRWGEALREVAARLEEMPGEEGYPASVPSRLAELYGRAGAARCLGREERRGSVTVVGAVSPPSGDLSEPLTQHSLRLAHTFWALSTQLAHRRHYPAVDPERSWSLLRADAWWRAHVDAAWPELRRFVAEALSEEARLSEIVQLVGQEALSPAQRASLLTGRMLREVILRQSARDPRDARCPPVRQAALLHAAVAAGRALRDAAGRGVAPEEVTRTAAWDALWALKSRPETDAAAASCEIARAFETLGEPS